MNDIVSLEELVEKYPWYSLAHLEMYKQMCKRGEEHRKTYLNIVASHIYSRTILYKYQSTVKKVIVKIEPEEEFTFELMDETVLSKPEKPVFIAGGEYFSKDDFEEIKLDQSHPLDKFIIERPSISKAKEDVNADAGEINRAEIFEDINFYTETLAKIYSEQGFYKRAIDVYAKLILLYPEKSAYFAALAQELKLKNNN
jgi:hypothetical protein